MVSREKLEKVLDDTVEYYSYNPKFRRAYANSKGGCMYITPNNRKCAVGRLLNVKGEKDFFMDQTIGANVFELLDEVWDEGKQYIVEPVKELPINFLNDLQCLHDSALNWTENGLSERGKKKADEIRAKICSGEYDSEKTIGELLGKLEKVEE